MSNRRVCGWLTSVSNREATVLDLYGDRISDIMLVAYQFGTSGLASSGVQTLVDRYRAKWPHIRWWLTIQAFDAASWNSLANGPSAPLYNTARAQVQAALQAYPWVTGIDLDAEGLGISDSAAALRSYQALGDVAKSMGYQVAAALPAATQGNSSIGGENWLDYATFGAYFDQVAIMTYDFAWSGSAPGPIAPWSWVKSVYDWAASTIPPEKLLMGVPAYAYMWHIESAIKDFPPDLNGTWPYRGSSGTYYAAWYKLTGGWESWGSQSNPTPRGQTLAHWLCYRDPDTGSPFGLMNCPWWTTASRAQAVSGMATGNWQGRSYATRYGVASNQSNIGAMADLSIGSQYLGHQCRPSAVLDVNGVWKYEDVHNLTVELLQRVPQSATIMDDDCANTGALDIYYTKASGTWTHWRQGDPLMDPRTYGQYRTTGPAALNLTALNSGGDYHMQARFQFATSGVAGVACGSFRAQVSSSGQLQLLRGSTVLSTASVSAPGVSTTPAVNQCVVGLRVRGNRARVYYGLDENNANLQLDYTDSSATTGPVGAYVTSGQVWYDHVRWGDAWWYNPREAVGVQVNGWTFWNIGRIPRTGVTWDNLNRFRVNADVEERETRTQSVSMDWDYGHLLGVGIPPNQTTELRILPQDTDVWVGATYLCDPLGVEIIHYSDADYIALCLDRADQNWNLDGIAIWQFGQEDTRLWERLQGARLKNRIPIIS